MNILIAYASKHGCTEECSAKLAQKLGGKVDLHDIKSGEDINLSIYDKVVIGSSVYVGKIHKEAEEFCKKNLEVLSSKKVGLFICGSQEGDALKQQLNVAYPRELQSKAAVIECFGGKFTFSKMNFMEKTIVKVISKTNKDTSNINEDKIDSFAQVIKSA
jgi:menaquinone-dependent protoporphyrinogen oxidase